ncbi:MarR family transcriptional regulator [Phenylobacterium sp.]|uniref:MarR family winged helix-turn-helix transcriptional regulator n=1 Tax=Phenylobacterium sp. TaxID=1871053 RepID=UPI0012224DAA|nr:MarR family transcriptional regulator [Phenylobacterium sp.]THD71529.1 MAG: MarR family transcriptional regulator [Phenylobacterium sp.]
MPGAAADLPETDDVLGLAELLRGPLLRVSRKLRQAGLKSGLSSQETLILGYLKKNPGAGVSELADFEQISRPTMSSHIKRLEGAGWIARAGHADDGRRQGLTVTPAGLRQHAAAQRHRNDWLAARLSSLTPEERARLAKAAGPLLKLTSEA